MTLAWTRRPPGEGASGKVRHSLTIACALSYAVSLALLGTSRSYGYFLLASILLGLPLLRPGLLRDFKPSRPLIFYGMAVIALLLLVMLHVMVRGSSWAQLDNVSRLGFGLVNGGFFYMLFSLRRERLFMFLLALALLHVLVAGTAIVAQALEASALAGRRFGGATNPIPFSELLMASYGLVAIHWIGRLGDRRGLLPTLGLAAFATLGLVGLVLTGTRGTLLALAPLTLLMISNLRGRGARLVLLAAIAALAAVTLWLAAPLRAQIVVLFGDLGELWSHGEDIGALSVSTGQRVGMWDVALGLAGSHLLFGYGAGSFPGLLADPALDLPAADATLAIYNQLHNQYLDLLLETGLVGLGLFALILGIPFVAGLRLYGRDRGLGCALMWVAACYACFGLSQSFFSHASTSLQIGAYLGILMWAVPAGGRPA